LFQNAAMDQHLQILINRDWIAPWADRLMAFLTNYGAWAPWLLLLVASGLIFGSFRLRASILTAALAIGLCDGIAVNFLKHAVSRPRPSQVEPGVRVVELGAAPSGFPRIAGILSEPSVTFPQGSDVPEIPGMQVEEQPAEGRSFPSGHAANNAAVATVLILFFPRWGWLYLPIALLISYSRIYTGSHWPLDVLAGILLGVLGGWIATVFAQFLWRHTGKNILPRLHGRHPNLL